MSEKLKKEKELKSFLAFQQSHPGCPRSSPIQPEPPSPDILFSELDLGIEITEYSLGQGKNGSLPKQHEIVHQRITTAAQAAFELKLTYHLQVSVSWTIFTKCPSVREENAISDAIAEMVASRISGGINICHVSWQEFSHPLAQKYGVELSFYVIPGQGTSCWSSMTCFSFPEEAIRIQAALDEKEAKVPEYKKQCKKVWLLITADRRLSSSSFSFAPKLLDIPFNTSFDRIFLLDEPQNLVYEFKANRD